MSGSAVIDLQRSYTAKERRDLFVAYAKACGAGDEAEADRILERLPIHPRWAKIIADVAGKEYLRSNFNITAADEYFGEGWLDGE